MEVCGGDEGEIKIASSVTTAQIDDQLEQNFPHSRIVAPSFRLKEITEILAQNMAFTIVRTSI